ncbi:MAG: hypothetical protein QUV08_02930 [Parasphingorhabdus sp.]|nr:hypothetical protein [Parasphingorhabdus sp.]
MKRAIVSPPVLISAILACLLCLSACSRRVIDYNYKITVEVETPEGLRKGYAVRRVVVDDLGELNITHPGAISRRIYGEAVAIDLPNNATLFALISDNEYSDDHSERWAIIPDGWAPPKGEEYYRAEIKKIMASKGKVFTLPPDRSLPLLSRGSPARHSNYPRFVRFTDRSDPRSLQLVDVENLAATFGEGYALKRITISITDEDVTENMENRLPWLSKHHGSLIDKGVSKPQLSSITEMEFRRGE